MFKVGDRVRIRQWDDMKREFGLDPDGDIDCGPCFTWFMRDAGLCGRTATIIDIDSNGYVGLDFDDKSGEINWCYSIGMLEPLEYSCIQVTSDVATTFEDMSCVLADLYSRFDAPNVLRELARVAHNALCEMKKYLKLEDDVNASFVESHEVIPQSPKTFAEWKEEEK